MITLLLTEDEAREQLALIDLNRPTAHSARVRAKLVCALYPTSCGCHAKREAAYQASLDPFRVGEC